MKYQNLNDFVLIISTIFLINNSNFNIFLKIVDCSSLNILEFNFLNGVLKNGECTNKYFREQFKM